MKQRLNIRIMQNNRIMKILPKEQLITLLF